MALFSDAEAELLKRGDVRDAILFRMATPKPVRAWAGPGPLLIPADTVEPAGAIFRGMGEIQGLPNLTSLINGKADRLDFTLANVSEEIAALADSESDDVRSSVCRLGMRLYDEDWAPGSLVKWVWKGRADVVRSAWSRDGDGNEVWSITVSVGTVGTGRTRPNRSTWTNPAQQERLAGDRFCERTPYYATGAGSIKWPRWG